MKIKLSLLALLFMSVQAFAWDVDKMNTQIEGSNVIVNGVCSGTVVSKKERLVLTAYHCVDNLFQQVTEKQTNPKTGEIREVTLQKVIPLKISVNKMKDFEVIGIQEWTAKVVSSDSMNDIALIQVEDTDYVSKEEAKLAPDSYMYKRGLKVYAVGNPAIMFDNSVTEGIISAPQRMLDIDGKKLKVFQFSAGIIGGNSGGSVVNDIGEMIGTVSASLRGSQIGFAVPISYTKDMIKKAGFGSILGVK